MGETLDNGVFTKSELSVGVGVTITLATLGFIRGNKNGFLLYFICIATGYTLLSISFILLDIAHISSIAFMIVSGLAQYFAHVPFTSGFYERQIAFLSIRNASSSFPLQINGVLGCVSTITCLVLQSLLAGHVNFVEFFRVFSYFMSGFGVLTTVGAAIYFIWYKGGTTKRVLDVLEQEDTETPKKYVFPK